MNNKMSKYIMNIIDMFFYIKIMIYNFYCEIYKILFISYDWAIISIIYYPINDPFGRDNHIEYHYTYNEKIYKIIVVDR